jgi:heme oxygenase (biliverdin-producing, ferredoxin)
MELATRIREAIMPQHVAIEELPLSKSMVSGDLNREAYADLLQQLLSIHDVLETELEKQTDVAIGAVYSLTMPRKETLRRDIAALKFEDQSVRYETTAYISQLQDWAEVKPWALAGCLYVLEGSRMGSMVMVKPIAAAMGVPVAPGMGVDYHFEGMTTRPRAWGVFKTAFNALPLDETQADDVLAAANATMQTLFDLYAAIIPAETLVVS